MRASSRGPADDATQGTPIEEAVEPGDKLLIAIAANIPAMPLKMSSPKAKRCKTKFRVQA